MRQSDPQGQNTPSGHRQQEPDRPPSKPAPPPRDGAPTSPPEFTAEGDPSFELVSERDPEGRPSCTFRWGDHESKADVEVIRNVALDLLTCAAYAEVMTHIMVELRLPAVVATTMFREILRTITADRPFGAKEIFWISPAACSTEQASFVVVKHGDKLGGMDPAQTRALAADWLTVAEGGVNDQLVSEALRTAGGMSAQQEADVFAYLRALRTAADAKRSYVPGSATLAEQDLPTTERLARALEEAEDDNLAPLIERARQGHYDEYKSDLAHPLVKLAHDLRMAGRQDFVQRVADGEFDATSAEVDAWAASPAGQAAFAELVESVRHPGPPGHPDPASNIDGT